MLYFQAMMIFVYFMSYVYFNIIEKISTSRNASEKKKINTVSKVIQSKTCHRQAPSDTMADKAIEYSKTIYSLVIDDIEVLILQANQVLKNQKETIGEMLIMNYLII